ncbi:hypothetical protein ABZ345_15325 [Lentzea sp. NPDC005914]|uniref:hypothetical protein n=1 Tax=Lentzea sp. NPDC005914 TaxID=3154572 RepID=UPI0033C83426
MNRSLILVSAAAALALAACTSTPDSNSAPAPTTSTSSTTPVVTEVVTQTVTNPPAPDAVTKVDGRIGYGATKLGMTLDEARAAGLTKLTWEGSVDAGCAADDKIAVSKKYGIERITLPKDAKTSKGIGVGSTFAEVKKAYPDASEYRAGWSASIDTNAHYAFLGEPGSDANKVVAIKIGASNVECSMANL